MTIVELQVASGKEIARDREETAVEVLGETIGYAILSSQGLRGRLRANCIARGISDNIVGGISETASAVGGVRADLERLRRELDEVDSALPDGRLYPFVSLLPPVGAAATAAAAAAEAIMAEDGCSSGDAARDQQERERSFYTRFYPHVFR